MTEQPRQHGFLGVFHHARSAMQIVYENLGVFVLAGLVWWASALTLVMVGPATLALYRLAQTATTGYKPQWREAWRDWRSNYTWSSVHALGWLVICLGIVANIQFYGIVTGSVLAYSLGLPLILIWLGIGIFLFPVALAYNITRFRATLGRATAELGRAPWRTCGIWLVGWLSFAISVLLTILLLLLPPFLAVWGLILLQPPQD